MGYERYPRGANPQGDYDGRQGAQDYGRDHGGGRGYGDTNARDRQAADRFGRDRDERDQDRYGYPGSAQRDQLDRGYGQPRRDRGQEDYRGSYGADARRFEGSGQRDDGRFAGRDRDRDHGRALQGRDHDDRGFIARAGDEVRSWFGDEDAERRREADMRQDERYGGRGRAESDSHYGDWRSSQIAAFDRDYEEYRREHRSKFENEFSSWRSNRQTQRDALGKVEEHMDVVGSDDAHVGTVDKVRGDRILLTKADQDAGGRHHSIPSSWISTVDSKVTLSKTADEAKKHWRDEERNQAMFGFDDREEGGDQRDAQGRILNRSFSGTY